MSIDRKIRIVLKDSRHVNRARLSHRLSHADYRSD